MKKKLNHNQRKRHHFDSEKKLKERQTKNSVVFILNKRKTQNRLEKRNEENPKRRLEQGEKNNDDKDTTKIVGYQRLNGAYTCIRGIGVFTLFDNYLFKCTTMTSRVW